MANVVIKNKRSQLLTITLFDASGVPQPVRLEPLSSSNRVDDSRITPYTQSLADEGGHLRITSDAFLPPPGGGLGP